MRRDKTLKICANHFVQPWMLLEAMKGSDRAWMWMVQADYAGNSKSIAYFTISQCSNIRKSGTVCLFLLRVLN